MIDERIPFQKEQINPEYKPEVNSTFQLQIDAIRSVDDHDIEKVEYIIKEKKAPLKIVKMSMSQTDCLQSLMGWNGCRGK